MRYWGPEAKTTEVEACVTLICASTDDSRPVTGRLNLIKKMVDWVASGSGPSLVHVCVAMLAALAGEMPGIGENLPPIDFTIQL